MFSYTAVTTIYNDEKKAIDLIKNMEKQTVPPHQIIIVDGGSGKKTIDLILDYQKESSIPIYYKYGERLNISQGFNMGIKLAKTEFVAIIAVGNEYAIDYFELLINKILEHTLDYAYSPFCGQNNTKFSIIYNDVILNKNNGMKLDIASNHGVLIKKKIFEDLNYFYEKFIYAGEDLEFYDLVKSKGYKGECVISAKLYWDTPHNLKQYWKQVKVYTIGKMQIYDIKEFLRKSAKPILYVLGMFLIIILCMIKWYTIGIGLTLIYVGFNLYSIVTNKSFEYVLFKNLKMFIEFFSICFQIKYLSKKYKVNRKEK